MVIWRDALINHEWAVIRRGVPLKAHAVAPLNDPVS